MSLIEKLIRPEIRQLSAYHVQDATGFIKLDAMENPYTFTDSLKKAWLTVLSDVDVNRYPDPSPETLKQVLREAFGISEQAEILLGNGSDELIQILALALSTNARGEKACVLAPEPGFVMYNMIAKYTNMNYVGVPLHSEDFSLPVEAMLTAIKKHQPAITYIAYPNNPTGNLFNENDIETIIQQASGIVVVDEAYNPFANNNSFMPLLDKYDNLIVMRTVSKMGLAGLRFGYMAGAKAWMAEFDKVRMPYNINALTQASIRFALENKQAFDEQAVILCDERARILQSLNSLQGVQAYPSAANFVLYKISDSVPSDAVSVFEALKDAGILIKNMHKPNSPLENCLRVTVGTPDENTAFLSVMYQLFS